MPKLPLDEIYSHPSFQTMYRGNPEFAQHYLGQRDASIADMSPEDFSAHVDARLPRLTAATAKSLKMTPDPALMRAANVQDPNEAGAFAPDMRPVPMTLPVQPAEDASGIKLVPSGPGTEDWGHFVGNKANQLASGINRGFYGSFAMLPELQNMLIGQPWQQLTGRDDLMNYGGQAAMRWLQEAGAFTEPETEADYWLQRTGESIGAASTFFLGAGAASQVPGMLQANQIATRMGLPQGRLRQALLTQYAEKLGGNLAIDVAAGVGGGAAAATANQFVDPETRTGAIVDFLAELGGGIGAGYPVARKYFPYPDAPKKRPVAETDPDTVAPPAPPDRPPDTPDVPDVPDTPAPPPQEPPRPEPPPPLPPPEMPPGLQPGNEAWSAQRPITAAVGDTTTVRLADGTEEVARYAVVEAEDLVASHNPETFDPRPDYPEGLQERAYHRDPREQEKVIGFADRFDPAFIYTDAPDGMNGPPIVTSGGVVLGGNGRAMVMQRVGRGLARGGDESTLRTLTEENASRFGIDPQLVRPMDRPVLVRQIETPAADLAEGIVPPFGFERAQKLVRLLNEGFSQGLGRGERGVSNAKLLSNQTIRHFQDLVAGAGDAETIGTIRDVIRRDRGFYKQLEADGIITPQRANEWVNPETGQLTEQGLDWAEDMLTGLVVRDADLLDAMPGDLKGRIVRATPAIVSSIGDTVDTDLRHLVEGAVRSEVRRRATGMSMDDFLASPDAFSPVPAHVDHRVSTLMRALAEKRSTNKSFKWSRREVQESFARYAKLAEEANNRQEGLFQTEPLTPEQAFFRAFEKYGALDPSDGKVALMSLRSPTNTSGIDAALAKRAARDNAFTDPTQPANGSFNPGPKYVGMVAAGRTNPDAPIPKKMISRIKILRDLAKELDLPIVQGPFRNFAIAHAEGYYRPANGHLEIKKWGDVQVATHEIMHGLYHKTRDAKNHRVWKKWMKETPQRMHDLKSISYDVDSATEGLSELMRLHMTNPGAAKSRVPELYDDFVEMMNSTLTPKQAKAFNKAAAQWRKFVEAGARHAIAEGSMPMPRDPGSLGWGLVDWMRSGHVDRNHFLRVFDEATYGGRDVPGGTYETARLLAGVEGWKKLLIEHGPPLLRTVAGEVKTMVHPTVRGLKHIAAGVLDGVHPRQHREVLNDWLVYGDARMAKEMLDQGREKLFTRTDVNAVLDGVKSRGLEERYGKAFDQMVEFNNAVMDYAVETGLIGGHQRAAFKRHQYAWGFFRQMSHANAITAFANEHPLIGSLLKGAGKYAPGSGKVPAFFEPNPGARKLRGSARYLKDPYERMMMGPMSLIQASQENMLKRQYSRGVRDAAGRFGDIIPPSSDEVVIGTKRIAQAVREAAEHVLGEDDAKQLGELIEDLSVFDKQMSFFIGGKRPWGDDVMVHFEAGQPIYTKITDEHQIQGFMGLREPPHSALESILRAGKNWTRRAVTANPGYVYANTFVRDPIMATIRTRDGWQHFTHSVRGLKHVLNHSIQERLGRGGDPVVLDFLSHGGAGAGMVASPADLERSILRTARLRSIDPRSILRNPKQIGEALYAMGAMVAPTPRRILHSLETISAAGELAPRVGEFQKLRARGVPGKTAALAGRDLTVDFSMRGTASWVRFAGNTMPFFNAMLVGGDNLIRAVSTGAPEHRARAASKLGLYMAGAMGLYAMNREDPAYRDMPWFNRLGYHHYIQRDDNGEQLFHFKLPRLFEVGMLASMAEGFLESYLSSDDFDTQQFGLVLWASLAHNFNITPPGGGWTEWIAEKAINKDLYTGRPIITMGMEGKDPWQQASPGRTNEIFRQLGVVQRELDPDGKGWVSPARLQAVFESTLASMSNIALMSADLMTDRGVGLHLDQLPVIRRAIEREGKYSKARGDFFEMMKEIADFNESMNNAKELEKQGLEGASDKYREQHVPGLYRLANRSDARVRRYTDKMRDVRNDPDLSRSERRDRLDDLSRKRDDRIRHEIQRILKKGGVESVEAFNVRNLPRSRGNR